MTNPLRQNFYSLIQNKFGSEYFGRHFVMFEQSFTLETFWCKTTLDSETDATQHLIIFDVIVNVFILILIYKKNSQNSFSVTVNLIGIIGRERKYHVGCSSRFLKTPRIFSWEFSLKINWKTIKTSYIHTTERICANNVEVREGRVIWRQYPARWGNQVPYPLAEVLSEKASEVSAPNIWHIS